MEGNKNIEARRFRNSDDDAQKVAKASNGKLDTDQVRILRALAMDDTIRIHMHELKDRVKVGISQDNKHSGPFWDSLKDLRDRKLVTRERIKIGKARKKYYYGITREGLASLHVAEVARVPIEDVAEPLPLPTSPLKALPCPTRALPRTRRGGRTTMTPTQAATVIGCSPVHVRYLCRNGTIKSSKQKLLHIPTGSSIA